MVRDMAMSGRARPDRARGHRRLLRRDLYPLAAALSTALAFAGHHSGGRGGVLCAVQQSVCDDPTCVVSGGACAANGDCCLGAHICEGASATSPGACMPNSAEATRCTPAPLLENCPCNVNGGAEQCAGLLECAPNGPFTGTCQVGLVPNPAVFKITGLI